MSRNYSIKEIKLMDEVNEVEVHKKDKKELLLVSLYATHDDDDIEKVKEKAKSFGIFGGEPSSLNGNYALKFKISDSSNSSDSLHNPLS